MKISSTGVVNFKEFSSFLRLDDYELDSALHRGNYIALLLPASRTG